VGWCDAVHICSGFWRERGGEGQRDPAGKRNARRLMTRGGWRGSLVSGHRTSRDVTRHVARLDHMAE
jgi:hypothetical protein